MSKNEGYSNLNEEEDEYVQSSEIDQQNVEQQQQPQQVVVQQQQQGQQPQIQQQPQYFYVVPTQTATGQPTYAYYPQVYYPNPNQVPQQQQQSQPQQQQQQSNGATGAVRLPPLPQLVQPQQQLYPQFAMPYGQQPQPFYTVPTTIPSTNPDVIPVTDESYVKVQGVEPILVLLCNLVLPGLGHMVMGQQTKGAVYFATNFLSAIIITVLSFFFIGFALIPLQLIYTVLIYVDGFIIAQRLKDGYPVLKGECWCRATSWFVSVFEKKSPTFVHGSEDEPAIWQLQCRQFARQQNL